MRKHALVSVLALCLIATGCSLWGKRAPGFSGATGGEQLQRAFLDEIKNKHWTEVEQRLSANFVLVTPGGVYDRAAAMERIRNLDLKGYTLSDLTVRPQGADAVIVYLISVDANHERPRTSIGSATRGQHLAGSRGTLDSDLTGKCGEIVRSQKPVRRRPVAIAPFTCNQATQLPTTNH